MYGPKKGSPLREWIPASFIPLCLPGPLSGFMLAQLSNIPDCSGKSQAVALGNEAPLACCSTEMGARIVEELIARIAHGVFS